MKRFCLGVCALLLAATACDAAEPDDHVRVLEDESVIEELEAALAEAQAAEAPQSLPPERELASFDDDEDPAVDPEVDELAAEIDPDEMRWDCGGDPYVCCRGCGWNICCCVWIDGEWAC